MVAPCMRKADLLLFTKGGLSHNSYCFFRLGVRLNGHHLRQKTRRLVSPAERAEYRVHFLLKFGNDQQEYRLDIGNYKTIT